jgi:DNA polymerase delta subunit 1
MVYKKLSSSALGDNTLKLLPMPGRFVFDLFHEVKREQKLDSYSLNFVSTKFLGDQKIDMSPKEMFRRFREENPDELRDVAEYCIKDTLLPHALMDKLYTFLNLVEMAKATWVPLCYLAERGQQIKVREPRGEAPSKCFVSISQVSHSLRSLATWSYRCFRS